MKVQVQLVFLLCCIIPIATINYQSYILTDNKDEMISDYPISNTEKEYCNPNARSPLLDEVNLTANWRFNEGTGSSASDSSGNGHTGTIDGADWCNGYQAQGLDLEQSSNQYINCGDNDAFTFTNGSDTFDSEFSFCAWIKLESVGVIQGLLGKYQIDQVAKREYFLRIGADNKLTFNLFDHTLNNYGHRIGIDSTTEFSTDIWYFIVATYDASEIEAGLKLYVNCTLETPISDSAGTYNGMGNGNTSLGLGIDGLTSELDGIFDEVRIYDKELSQAEINDLFNYTIAAIEGRTAAYQHYKFTGKIQGDINGITVLSALKYRFNGTTITTGGNATNSTGHFQFTSFDDLDLSELEYCLQINTTHYIHEFYFQPRYIDEKDYSMKLLDDYWDFSEDDETWSTSHAIEYTINGTYASARDGTSNFRMIPPIGSIDSDTYYLLKVRMKSNATESVSMRITDALGNTLDSDYQSLTSDWEIYSYDLSSSSDWSGQETQIRIRCSADDATLDPSSFFFVDFVHLYYEDIPVLTQSLDNYWFLSSQNDSWTYQYSFPNAGTLTTTDLTWTAITFGEGGLLTHTAYLDSNYPNSIYLPQVFTAQLNMDQVKFTLIEDLTLTFIMVMSFFLVGMVFLYLLRHGIDRMFRG